MNPALSLRRARRAPASRFARIALAIAGVVSASAHAEVVMQQNFSTGLGSFTASGSVSTSSAGARLNGAFGSNDGAIRSATFSTAGLSGLTLTFTRSSSGLDLGEAGIAEISTNNGSTFTALESSRTASGTTTLTLPASAAGQVAVVLRFRVSASS